MEKEINKDVIKRHLKELVTKFANDIAFLEDTEDLDDNDRLYILQESIAIIAAHIINTYSKYLSEKCLLTIQYNAILKHRDLYDLYKIVDKHGDS